MSLFIETLEDRSLMSASHPAVLLPSVSVTIATDQAAVISARQKIVTDTALFNAQLREAQINVKVVRSQDLATLTADRHKFTADRGNSIARQADQGQLLVDQAKLRADVVAANQAIKTVAGERKIGIATDRATLKVANATLRRDRLLRL